MPTVEANGLSFHVVDEGEGPVVLLLHGFPDSSHLWRHQVRALVEAGFRAVAPDLRGFGRSDKPEGVEAYAAPNLLADVGGLLAALGVGRFSVVGHDWGAFLAWATAAFMPEQVERLCVISVGHPGAFAAAGYEQWEKSWYMLWWQFPGAADAALPRDDWRLLRAWTRGAGDTERYIEDLARPGALTAGLNWYRANISPEMIGADAVPLPPVACPTLGVWSTGDVFLTEGQMTGSQRFVTGPWRYERIGDASHWVPVDQPDRLNRLLVDFLGS
jgi:pimeloyl-ACP methyl ester carboxylesterase